MDITILYNAVSADGSADELDVLNQRDSVTEALALLGHKTVSLPLSLNLSSAAEELDKTRPALVFNLVESLDKSGRLIHLAPALLEHLQIPFTGAGSEAMFLTTNKLLAKERLRSAGLATPDWLSRPAPVSGRRQGQEVRYLLKPVWEDASVGIDDQADLNGFEETARRLDHLNHSYQIYFAEQYIHGREFNLSLLAAAGEPDVLPAAEIEFIDYPDGRPRIVGYKAKWASASFEYTHTVRRLEFPPEDFALIEKMQRMAVQCWHLFNLRGYARVDFRVDLEGTPWILEINANPCIAPDSGFVAGSNKTNLRFDQVIERILADVPGRAEN